MKKMVQHLENLRFEVELKLKLGNKTILDPLSAQLLENIEETGTILGASRKLEIPYSKAWLIIKKIEESIGSPIVEKHRGGAEKGYTRLTKTGKELLRRYLSEIDKLGIRMQKPKITIREPDLTVIGSDDTLLREFIDMMSRDMSIEYHALGSLVGILHIVLEDADIVVSHLYDPDKDEYNISYIKKLGLDDAVNVYRGYIRTLVLAAKDSIYGIEECLAKIRKIATRGAGSGTLIIAKRIIAQHCMNKQIRIIPCRTHRESTIKVLTEEADACIALEYEAKKAKLRYIPIKEEFFDFIIPKQKTQTAKVLRFLDFLRKHKDVINRTPGYKVPREFLRKIL